MNQIIMSIAMSVYQRVYLGIKQPTAVATVAMSENGRKPLVWPFHMLQDGQTWTVVVFAWFLRTAKVPLPLQGIME